MNDSFMVIAFAGLAAAILAVWMNRRIGRIVFWTGTLVFCVAIFLTAYPPNWKSGLTASLTFGCLIVVAAYLNTDLIRIRRKTYSLFKDPKEIDDYGFGLTAMKTWWLLTPGMILFVVFGISRYVDGDHWISAAVAAIVVLVAASFGYRDAITIKPIAAGQRIQLGLMSVVTAGIFLVAYLCGYHASKRWVVPRQAYGRHQR